VRTVKVGEKGNSELCSKYGEHRRGLRTSGGGGDVTLPSKVGNWRGVGRVVEKGGNIYYGSGCLLTPACRKRGKNKCERRGSRVGG